MRRVIQRHGPIKLLVCTQLWSLLRRHASRRAASTLVSSRASRHVARTSHHVARASHCVTCASRPVTRASGCVAQKKSLPRYSEDIYSGHTIFGLGGYPTNPKTPLSRRKVALRTTSG